MFESFKSIELQPLVFERLEEFNAPPPFVVVFPLLLLIVIGRDKDECNGDSFEDIKPCFESTPNLLCLFSSEILVLNELSCDRFNFIDTLRLCAVCVRLSRSGLVPIGFRFIVIFLLAEESASSSLL